MKISTIIAIVFVAAVGIALWRYPSSYEQVVDEPAANVLRVGTSADYKPFSYYNDNGKMVGLDIDIVSEVAKRIGKKLLITDMPFDMLTAQLQTGAIDVIAAGLSPTPERAKQADFTLPHYYGPPLVMISLKKTPIIHGPEGLVGKHVIVNQGFTADEWIKGIPGPIVQKLPTVADAFLALQQEKGDVFITAEACVKPFFNKYGKQNFNIVPLADTVENVSLAVSKTRPQLFIDIQKALGSMIDDGTLGAISKKWNP